MEPVSLFGAGFIGGRYAETYSSEVEVMERDRALADTPNILYLISTVHNYNPKDGNPFIDIETNLELFMDTLDRNKLFWDAKMVFNLVSTWFVYGATDLPAKEISPCNPT